MNYQTYEILREMWLTRHIVRAGLAERKKHGIPVRQPLQTLYLSRTWLNGLRNQFDEHFLKTKKCLQFI